MTCCILQKLFTYRITGGYTITVLGPYITRTYTRTVHVCEAYWGPQQYNVYHITGSDFSYRDILDPEEHTFITPIGKFDFTVKCGDKVETVTERYREVKYIHIPASLYTYNNLGWKDHAIAISKLDLGKSLRISVAPSVYGVFVGVSSILRTKPIAPSLFNWGLLFDVSSVKVLENGRVSYVFSNVYSVSDDIRIRYFVSPVTRRNVIAYYFNDAVWISSIPVRDGIDLYPYALLYAANDTVLCAEYLSAPTERRSASLYGFSFIGNTVIVNNTIRAASRITATSVLRTYVSNSVFLHSSSFISTKLADSVFAVLPSLVVLAASVVYSYINVTLPRITCSVIDIGGEYIPPTPVRVAGYLPSFVLFSEGITIHSDSCNGTIQPFIAIASDYPYGFVVGVLPAFLSNITERVRLRLNAYSAIVANDVNVASQKPISRFWDTAYGYRSYVKPT